MAARIAPITTERDFHILSREISHRLSVKRITRKKLSALTNISEGRLSHLINGYRGVSKGKQDSELKILSELLAYDSEDPREVSRLLSHLNDDQASVTDLILYGSAPIRFGYLNWKPFAWTPESNAGETNPYPTGFLIELFDSYAQVLGARVEWIPLEFHQFFSEMSNKNVDAVLGFVLETTRRHAVAEFVPLKMPFSIGLNAVTNSPKLNKPMEYKKAREILIKYTDKNIQKEEKITTIAVRDEIGDEYFPAILPELKLDTIESDRTLQETFKYYAARSNSVIFADHISCAEACERNQELQPLFESTIGEFFGGSLLPQWDMRWSNFFKESTQNFFRSKPPIVAILFEKYRNMLEPFITGTDQQKVVLEKWLTEYWPSNIDWSGPIYDEGKRN